MTLSDSRWFELGRPEGTSVDVSLGGARLGDQTFIVIQAKSGNVWVRGWSGKGWVDWLNLGQPAGGLVYDQTVIGTISAGPMMFIFAPGNDGQLWCAFWNGATWQWVPIGKPLQTVTVSNVLLATVVPVFGTYVRGSDGNVYCAVYVNNLWVWVPQPGVAESAFPRGTWPSFLWEHSYSQSGTVNIGLTDWPVTNSYTDHIRLSFYTVDSSKMDEFSDSDTPKTGINTVVCLFSLNSPLP